MSTATATRIKLNASFWRHSGCVPFSEDVIPSSLFLKHRHFLVIDVETQKLVQDVGGWEHVDKLGISVACAYDSKSDQFLSFREHELKKLIDLCEERLVVGYNIRGFDLAVMAPYGLDPKKLDVFDIMYDLEALTRQRFLKLEYVAQGTLNAGKSADGLLAVEWWKQGQIDKIIEYCLQDVRVTRDIFQFGRQNGFVKIRRSEDTEKSTQVPVQWN
jgi:DEAD/DEAH box helicase domain-containing protein